MSKKDLIQVAKEVRKWAFNSFGEDAPDDLNCFCAICSFEIFRRLKSSGHKPIFHQINCPSGSESHCIVECEGYSIDVTATQFNDYHSAVNVFPKSQTMLGQIYCWYWDLKHSVFKGKTRKDIAKIMSVWEESQIHPSFQRKRK